MATATEELLKSVRDSVRDLSAAQTQQQRVTDQQATLIRRQEETLQDALEEIEDLLHAVRGSVDGSQPSIHEQIRKLTSKLEGIETDLRTKTGDLHTALSALRVQAGTLEEEHKKLSARVSKLEHDAAHSKGWQAVLTKIAIGVILLIVGAGIQAVAAWLY